MLDLLVVIWLMITWLKILVAAFKSWYRQPPRYVKDGKVKRKKTTFRMIKTSASNLEKVYESGYKSTQDQAVERAVHDKVVLEKTLNPDIGNLEQEDKKSDFKALIEGPKLQRRNDNSLATASNDAGSKTIAINDQVAVSRVCPADKHVVDTADKHVVDKSIDFERVTEGPKLISRTDQSWGSHHDGSEKIEGSDSAEIDSNLLWNIDNFDVDNSHDLKHRIDENRHKQDLITTWEKTDNNGKNDFDRGKKHNIDERFEHVGQMNSKECSVDGNIEKGTADVSYERQKRTGIQMNSSEDSNIEGTETLLGLRSCEQNVNLKEMQESSTLKITLHKENAKEMLYAYKIKGHSEASDKRKEKAAVKEATLDADRMAKEFQKVRTSCVHLKSKQELSVDTNSGDNTIALQKLSSDTELLDNSFTVHVDGHFETEQSTKLKHSVEVKEKSASNTLPVEYMELTSPSAKVRKSDVPKVSELLLDLAVDCSDSATVDIKSESFEDCVVDQTSFSVSKDADSTELKTATADSEIPSAVETETNQYTSHPDKDSVKSIPSIPTSLEYRLYQTNGSCAASIEQASRSFGAELDHMFTKYQNKTVGESLPPYETMSYSRVAPKLEVVTKTMQHQVAASSVLSRIPYSSSFGLMIESPAKDSKRRHRSQPMASQETKLDLRRSSLGLFACSYDFPNQKDYAAYSESKARNSKAKIFSGNDERILSCRQSSQTNIWKDISHTTGTAHIDTNSDVTKPVYGLTEQITEASVRRLATDSSSDKSDFESFKILPESKSLTCRKSTLEKFEPDFNEMTTKYTSYEDKSHWRDETSAVLGREQQVQV